MSEEKGIPHSEMVDKFIASANEYARTEAKERIGAAMMFAAARFNAFDASTKSKNLLADKGDAIEWYTHEYRRMLEANLDEFIGMQS